MLYPGSKDVSNGNPICASQQGKIPKQSMLTNKFQFIAAGIHEYNKKELRYLIMPRFGRDLQKVFEENGKKFGRELIAQIATKILYAIQYMHGRRYAHADIKVNL